MRHLHTAIDLFPRATVGIRCLRLRSNPQEKVFCRCHHLNAHLVIKMS